MYTLKRENLVQWISFQGIDNVHVTCKQYKSYIIHCCKLISSHYMYLFYIPLRAFISG